MSQPDEMRTIVRDTFAANPAFELGMRRVADYTRVQIRHWAEEGFGDREIGVLIAATIFTAAEFEQIKTLRDPNVKTAMSLWLADQ